jgi:DNA-binding response OmpR family regulator
VIKKRILVIEDDRDIVELVRYNLEKDGYQVATATDGAIGMAQVKKSPPDLLVLDLMLPKLSGLEICKEVRRDAALNRLPILILTARGEEADRVVGLELGADDYVTKPFSIRELLARVKAVLRRSQTLPKEQDRYTFGDVEVNLRSYRVMRGGHSVEFSSKEFELLKHFLCHSGETLSRDRLLEEVWGYDNFPTTRTVDAHIVRLRQKLEPVPDQPQFFLTVHGVGYRFVG